MTNEKLVDILRDIRTRIKDHLVALDEPRSQLETLISTFTETLEGGSCTVYGHRQSGKKSLVKRCLPWNDIDIDVHWFNGLLWSETKALNFLEKAGEGAKIVIVSNAEQFVMKTNQNLVYKLLEATRNKSWFVVLVTSRHDFEETLEKRVRSRLSKIKIKCDFLTARSGSTKWNAHIAMLMKSHVLRNRLEGLLAECGTYGALKAVATLFLSDLIASKARLSKLSIEVLEEIFIDAVKSITPDDASFLSACEGLSLRQLCLVVCIQKLDKAARARSGRASHSYKNISLIYMKMVNEYFAILRVNNVHTLYKELDHLRKLGFLAVVTETQAQMQFRRVQLTFDNEVFETFLEKAKTNVPTHIAQWFDEVHVT
ncbi:hypothetical protein L596_026626 [Steinernema carpocapsae]|uniref:Origin recognition complex subunit 4 n=1 Tax=Steinernema carpocapsae TaxID=34508 RepID=A0A4V5ZY84_STECR|nr:hypothetical protein L596_026626 [Steinernema carpocapsae]